MVAAGNRITNDGTWTYSYDAAETRTKKSKGPAQETWTYEYDLHNHLTRVEKRASDGGTLQQRIDYQYDALGNRIRRTVYDGSLNVVEDQKFGVDGWDTALSEPRVSASGLAPDNSAFNVWADLDASNNLTTRRLFGNSYDAEIARISSAGTLAYYVQDRQNTVRFLTDAGGTVQATIVYDAFGNITSNSNSSFTDRYTYTGRENELYAPHLQYGRDRTLGLDILRWTSPDRVIDDKNNGTRYLLNGPTNATDPSGLEEKRSVGVPPIGYPVFQWLLGREIKKAQESVEEAMERRRRFDEWSHRILNLVAIEEELHTTFASANRFQLVDNRLTLSVKVAFKFTLFDFMNEDESKALGNYWTDERQRTFKNNFKKVIEDWFNNNPYFVFGYTLVPIERKNTTIISQILSGRKPEPDHVKAAAKLYNDGKVKPQLSIILLDKIGMQDFSITVRPPTDVERRKATDASVGLRSANMHYNDVEEKRTRHGLVHIPAVHEFGHLLGVDHPGQYNLNAPKPGSWEDYDADSESLMGSGMGYRARLFEIWRLEMKRLHPDYFWEITR